MEDLFFFHSDVFAPGYQNPDMGNTGAREGGSSLCFPQAIISILRHIPENKSLGNIRTVNFSGSSSGCESEITAPHFQPVVSLDFSE